MVHALVAGWGRLVALAGVLALAGAGLAGCGVPETDDTDSDEVSYSYTAEGAKLTWRKANLTNFTSYPDPNSDECKHYNGCKWAGQFAFVDGKKPESWVKAHNILAVHHKDAGKYRLKTLRLKQGSHQIDAKVYDECADSDCSGCCTKNSKSTGFLIDIEKYTKKRFGSGDGIVQWTCIDC